MATARDTFIVQVHDDGGTVIEHGRTHDRVWLRSVADVAEQITAWLEPVGAPHIADASSDQPTSGGHPHGR